LKSLFTFLLILCVSFFGLSQESDAWFYLRAIDTLIQPEFRTESDKLIYIGKDSRLKEVLDRHEILTFKKTFKKAKKTELKRTFFVISKDEGLLEDLLANAAHLFEFGELILEDDKKIFEPNDYGLTSTIGENLGLQVNMDYYDFLDVPKAWYYTTGLPETIIGISDGKVDTTNIDFKDKIKVFGKTFDIRGHGSGVASIAAGQGDNAYGVPGVCYDCGIYSTRYGDFKYLKQLLELSEAGAKVINCSWVGTAYYETAQAAIDEIYANGTLIVAAAGNTNWNQNDQGKKLYYPASYNNVISVSTAHYKHDKVSDNTLSIDGYNYADNIKHHIGRTMGFKDNDPSKSYTINQVSVATINEKVDILAPSSGVIRFSRFIKDGGTEYISVEATSPAAPFVTGTIGLMYSLYPCLPHDEVESILKFTSVNIDHIDANRPYKGMYGSGTLNVGKAVKMVYDLVTPESIVYIENQHFSRWNFKLTSLSKEVVLRNQKFTDDATLDLKAKNKIIIKKNTVLKPNTSGSISLQIVPSLRKECDLQLRDPGIED